MSSIPPKADIRQREGMSLGCKRTSKADLGRHVISVVGARHYQRWRRQDRLIGTKPTSSVARAANEVVRPLPAEFTCLVLGELPGISEELRQGQ